MLLKSQVLMQDSMERGFKQFRQEMDEITDKLNGLIGAVDQSTVISRRDCAVWKGPPESVPYQSEP